MDLLYKIWAFFGFLAFIQIGGIYANSARTRRKERSESGNLHAERSSVKDDMTEILAPRIGKEISLDFYEDEEDMDLLFMDKHHKSILLDIDPKWALIRIETSKTHKEKLIRISSIKGVAFKE